MKALALALSVLFAQSPYVETFEVRVQSLDVIVTDKKGNPVGGLTKDDFVVLDAGVVQEVSNFSAYRESTGSVTSGAATMPAPAPPSEPLQRKVAFYVDDMSLHPSSRAKIVRSAMQFLEGLGPQDQAMVVTATGPANVVQSLTSDRAALRRALDQAIEANHFRANSQVANELRFLVTQMTGTMPSNARLRKAEMLEIRRRYASMVKRRVEQRLGGLRALVASMSGLEGKKVLVLMTSSLAAMPGLDEATKAQLERMDDLAGDPADSQGTFAPTVYDLRPMIEDLGRTAAASGITIYPIQPDVQFDLLAPGSSESRANTRYRGAETFESTLYNNQLAITSLAETTGGRWFRGDGRIDDVFRQVATDVRSYYSLAYHVKNERDQARRVEVRVKNRPDLTVRTRRDVIEKSMNREMTDLTMAALLYTHPVNELGITATAAPPRRSLDAWSIAVEVQIPMDKLTFLPEGEGRYSATFRVHYAATGETIDFTADEERQQRVNIDEEQFRGLAGKVFRYTTNIVVTRGRYRVAVGVLDTTSRLSGFQTVSVDIK